jgi:predicted RNase H-like nuclease
MTDKDETLWLAGIDGCPGGWIVVFARPHGTLMVRRVVEHFDEIAIGDERPAIIAVDVPIGLPARSPAKSRLAESAVRPLLGDRKSSVFRIPSRAAVYASVASEPADERERFFAACDIARKTSDDSKAFSKQSFYILDKVVEVDAFLRKNTDYISRVFETHPELAFVRMNGGKPLDHPKKSKNRVYPPGLELRRGLLRRASLPDDVIGMKPPNGAAEDDLIDALACVVTARHIHGGRARCHPDPPDRDEHGLPMAVWV